MREESRNGLGRNRVQNHSEEQDANAGENEPRIALGLHQVGEDDADKHGGAKEKGNGARQAVAVDKDEHNQGEAHGGRTSDKRSSQLSPVVRWLRMRQGSSTLLHS